MAYKTLEDIYSSMKICFEEESGQVLAEGSAIGLSLMALAGEIFNLSENIRYRESQCFPDTAVGEYLERHCEERGLVRKEALKAKGKLCFIRDLPTDYSVTVPMGTVCCSTGDSGLTYITTQEGTIGAYGTQVTVSAEAVESGSAYNCKSGTVNSIVSGLQGIDSVVNPEGFLGGQEEESDEHLRKRLLESYSALPNGVNSQYYKRYVLDNFSTVSSCGVKAMVNGVGTVGVYVWGANGMVNEDLLDEINLALQEKREINVVVSVENAIAHTVNSQIYIKPKADCSFSTAKVQVVEAVSKYFSLLGVGDSVYRADIGRYIMENTPIENCYMPTGLIDFIGDEAVVPILGMNTVVAL